MISVLLCRKQQTLAAILMAWLSSSCIAHGQEIQGRVLPDSAFRGGIVARVPGSVNGINGSAGRANTLTGIGVPTGASAINRNARLPAPANDRRAR